MVRPASSSHEPMPGLHKASNEPTTGRGSPSKQHEKEPDREPNSGRARPKQQRRRANPMML